MAVEASTRVATAVHVTDRAGWEGLIKALQRTHQVWAPIKTGEDRVVLQQVDDPTSIRVDAHPTLLPTKKVYRAPEETLFRFSRKHARASPPPESEAGVETKPLALVGIHPCDLRALQLLDRVFTGFFVDDRYSDRRARTFIVVGNCVSPFPSCFCTSFNSGPFARDGFDLAVTKLDDRYLLQAGSPAGQTLLAVLEVPVAGADELAQLVAAEASARQRLTRRVETDGLTRLLNMNVDHPVWDDVADQCLCCGACTAVCPTCYCFSVRDRLNLDLETGERRVAWTSCLVMEFSQVALGHNPRHHRVARVKQRLYHKFSYFNDQYGEFGCVGCGRCVDTCVADLDPVKILAKLK